MPPRIADRLGILAEGCSVAQVTRDGCSGDGWKIDSWTLDAGDIDRLLDVYRELLAPSYDEKVQDLLRDRGIDLDALLVDEENSKELITRADLCELAAVASLLAASGWPAHRLHMPNIPKGSRKKSESGIDAISTTLQTEVSGDLTADEQLLLASVKHTTSSAARLRSALVTSVTEEFTPGYLATQLRVYEERLRQMDPDLATDRLFLFLDGFPDAARVRIVAVAVVDPGLEQDLAVRLCNLPNVPDGVYSMRILYVPGLAGLHERAV